jgi:glycosyltransferase involved in cell wall biosynthesis
MNILVVSFYQVYPLETGASIAQFGIIDYLSNQCNLNISLLLPENTTLTDKELSKLNQLLPKVKIYTINNHSSNVSISSKLLDFVQIIKYKIKFFFKYLLIIFRGDNNLKNALLNASLEVEFINMYSLGNPYYIHSEKYVEKIKEIIWQDKIGIVQLEYVDNLNLITIIPPHVRTVFVEHESIFYRIKSHRDAKQIKSVVAEYVMQFYKSVEIALLEKVDGVITFTASENFILKNALKDKNSQIKFLISPFPVLKQDFRKIDRENFKKPNKLIFVGGEHHFPNKDAVEWFLEETAAEVFRQFGLRLYVVGKWKPSTVKRYKSHPSRVEFVGFIEDLYEISKDSISIAPVRIGGGLKTKVLLAMAQGLPVICTKFAIEGINAQHLESVMIADTKDSFCWCVEYLMKDLNRTFMICQNAQNLIKQAYSQPVVSELRYEFYKQILEEDKDNR